MREVRNALGRFNGVVGVDFTFDVGVVRVRSAEGVGLPGGTGAGHLFVANERIKGSFCRYCYPRAV